MICPLIYLGVRAFLAKPGATERKQLADVTLTQAFFQAVGAEVLNPKTAIFFLAFLPQSIHPEWGSSLIQFAVLGLIFSALSATYTSVLALSIRPLSLLIKGLAGLRRWEGKIIGTMFVGLGVKVAFQQRQGRLGSLLLLYCLRPIRQFHLGQRHLPHRVVSR